MGSGIEQGSGPDQAKWKPPERPKSPRDLAVDKAVANARSREQEKETSEIIQAAIKRTQERALKEAVALEGEDINLDKLRADREAVAFSSRALESFEKAKEIVGNMKDHSEQKEVLSKIGGGASVESAKQSWAVENFKKWLSVIRRERVLKDQEEKKQRAA